MYRFEAHHVERLSPDQCPRALADAIVFRLHLDHGDTGLAWVSEHDAIFIGNQLTPQWVADKLNRLLFAHGYDVVHVGAMTKVGWQLDGGAN